MAKETQTTPLMEQYLAIKKKHQNAVLFFRMGDFYEMFYKDAKIAAEVLGITLTSRAHGKSADVPLAGFPHHALDIYLAKMIKAGYRVAVCEQLEDPKKAKTIVKRDVVEIVTPGTAVSDDLLETKRNNFLVAVYTKNDRWGVAQVDVSTGEFQVTQVDDDAIAEKIAHIDPAELLVADNQIKLIQEKLRSDLRLVLSPRDEWTFLFDYAQDILLEHFNVLSLKGFGVEDLPLGIGSAGAILSYLKENQKHQLVHINNMSRFPESDYMIIDHTTRTNLELLKPLNREGKQGTLLNVLDHTHTPMGGRLLVQWLSYPLLIKNRIDERLDAVESFVRDSDLAKNVTESLKHAGDLERLMAKFSTGRANARDARAIAHTLQVVQSVKCLLEPTTTHFIQKLANECDPLEDLVEQIDSAIVDNPPLSINDGGVIKDGYHEELDELRKISFSGKDWIARLQTKERENTGIPSLKVNYNKVFGYYIEVTRPHLTKVPNHYIRKQTLVNAERFITQELKEYEEKILGAEEKIYALEYELFDELRHKILLFTQVLQKNARTLARVDCLSCLAHIAVENQYARPEITEDKVIHIKQGRHPVVEKLLPAGEQFVSNDCKLDNDLEQILVITGPNMAGKSTYLRQVGLVVIMAQMGCYVPAQFASIGVVDRVFTRVGASDNLAAGESTFLREMNETANILNNATSKSLIILDEIGRGTSTFDGLSIAWAVTEYLHNTTQVAAKTIFATHYHELTELELVLPRVKNYNVAVKEWGDHIVFLRKIVPGGCDHSYGIQVAKLAGLPVKVIERAKEILLNLENEALDENQTPRLAEHRKDEPLANQNQLSLFAELEKQLSKELKELDPNQLTPIQALQKLDELRQLANRYN
jgi:DNA mismatch repair protein MutS